MSKEIEEHVLRIYEPQKLLGSGAYGHVWKALDRRTQKPLALKKIFDAFQNSTDAQRTYRQLAILTQLDHQNIVKLHRALRSKNNRDLYLVFQLVQADLHSLVGQNILQTTHIRFIASQLLRALKYLHSAQLIHRDLKPSNVLINSQCKIKLCDFGLARSLTRQQQQQLILTEEVATRWYRSPQMLLGSKNYGKPTDVWSVGCIIAELMIGQPLFPGDSTLNQLEKIIEFTGAPSKQSVDSLQSDHAQSLLNQLSVRKRHIKDYFKNCDMGLQQLVLKMLEFSPKSRITIDSALKHPCLKQFQQEEILCQKFIVPPIDDNIRLTTAQYRKLIYQDIERLYPQETLSIKKQYRSAHSFTKSKNRHEEHTPERRQRSMIQPNRSPLKLKQPNVSKPLEAVKPVKPENWQGLKRMASKKQLLRKKGGKPAFDKK